MEKAWEGFIKELMLAVNMKISNLNPHREYILKDNQLRKRIILSEIRRNNFKSPFDMIDPNYTREYYNTNLLIDQLKSITNIFNTTKSFPEIMERKENLEIIKKIISQYIEYLVSNNFELILNELFKLESTENSLNNAILMIKNVKNNLNLFKIRYITCSMKIVLKKQKYNNLCKMKNFLEKTLNKWHNDYKEAQNINEENNNDDIGNNLFYKYNKIQNEIILWKNEKNDINSKNNNLLIPEIFIQNLKKKMENIKIIFDDKLSTIFTIPEKKNLINIYNLFCTIKVLSKQDPIEAFKLALKKSMRDSLFNIIKDILSQNMNNVYNINMQNITTNKFSIFKLYSLKEKEFFKIINTLLSKIICIPECYYNYLTQEKDKGNIIGKLLTESSKEFYDLFEKKITKVIKLICPNLSNSIEIININQPFVKYISCLNIFTMTLQYYFKTDDSKYLKPYMFDLVKKQLNFKIKYFIKKICVFLGTDIWKRIPYEEKVNPIFLGVYNNNTNFGNKNNNSNLCFNYKKFMPLFSKESYTFIKNIKKASNDTYESIPELFSKFINEHESVLSNIKYNQNIALFSSSRNLHTNLNLNRANSSIINQRNPLINKENKEQNEQDEINMNNINILISSKNIVSAATITTLKFIREFLENIFLFPCLKDYIFKKILILFEYYFIGSLNILMFNKQYFAQIFKLVDIVNMKRPNGLITTSEFASFLENFIDLKKFLTQALKNFSEVFDNIRVNLFEDSNKFNNNNMNELLEQNKIIFPRLNPSMPLDTNNKYCLLIETIVLVESIFSVYKYTKKFKKILYKINTINNTENEGVINNNIISAEFDSLFMLYKKALNQLSAYLYKPICLNILIIKPILRKISDKNWDIQEKPNLDNINENYINLLIDEIIEKKDKLDLLSGCSITSKSFIRFFYVLMDVVITFIMNKISKIETWSDIGRNLFYDEMNVFKNILNIKLKEKNLDANIDKFFDKLFKYVKSWFFNEEQIIKYINEDKIEFKYIKSIIENGKEFKDKNIEDKKKFLIKIEEMYYGLISDLNLKLSSIK